ncbi:MAG: malto-oligosyltrehalose synthase, partial [Angustibacter sp.]
MTAPEQPVSTYRWQIQPGFGFDEAADQVDYLATLGITHAYLSPILAACPGSTHGYDVIDQGQLSPAAGGRAAFDRLSYTLQERHLGAIADVVPNHMAVPTPEYLNAPLWSVLQAGPDSPFAHWFDIDWSVGDRALLMPVLGQRIGQALTEGHFSVERLHIDDLQPVLRYFDHVFPLRSGTESLPLLELLDRQWYRLAHWRVADEEVNYRRFFDVDTLAAIRVEEPDVFEATHRLLLDLVAAGQIQGLRIDHPDGLADPQGYLERLAAATGGLWVVVEKILDGAEALPEQWACAGTSGYDALHRLGGIFVDPAGAAPLSSLLGELTGENESFSDIARQAKLEVIRGGLYAEVHRLVDLLVDICQGNLLLRDHTRSALLAATTELLVAMDRYRAYIRPPTPASQQSAEILTAAADRAQEFLPDHQHDTLRVVQDLVLGRIPGRASESIPAELTELVVRFQQTCGPVMAKGVEDTAFYRYPRLISLTEVGANPDHFGVAAEEFHDYFARQQERWPRGMTTLST